MRPIESKERTSMSKHRATGNPRGRPSKLPFDFGERMLASFRRRVDPATGLVRPLLRETARELGVSRSTVNRWEVNQTANGPENKSNKYGYYKELRTNPDLRGAYYELVNCVKRYQAEKRKADKLGIRFVTFVRFREEWLTHQPDKMRHLRMG